MGPPKRVRKSANNSRFLDNSTSNTETPERNTFRQVPSMLQGTSSNETLSKESNFKIQSSGNELVDMTTCPYWQLARISLTEIKQLESIDLKMHALLRKSQVLSTSEIIYLLGAELTSILTILPSIALLVRGNWVIKSNLLYNINRFHDSETKQNHYKELCAARDFILLCFVRNHPFTLAQIYHKYKQSTDHEEILQRLTIRKGWHEPIEFILPDDNEYMPHSTNPIVHRNHSKALSTLIKHEAYLQT